MDELTAVSVLLATAIIMWWWPSSSWQLPSRSSKRLPTHDRVEQLLSQLQSEVQVAAGLEAALEAAGWRESEVPETFARRMRDVAELVSEHGCRSSQLIEVLAVSAKQLQQAHQRWSSASAAAYSTSLTLLVMPVLLWALAEGLGSHALTWLVASSGGWICLVVAAALTVGARRWLRWLERTALAPRRRTAVRLPSSDVVGIAAFVTPLLFRTDIYGLLVGVAARLATDWLWQGHQQVARAVPADEVAWATSVLAATLDAGLDWLRAVRITAEVVQPALTDALERVAQRLEWGIDPFEAFGDIAPEFDHVCAALVSTYRTGAPIAQSLFKIAQTIQQREHAATLTRIEKLGASSIVPVAALQLPAFVIVGIVPLAVTQLLPMLGLISSTGVSL